MIYAGYYWHESTKSNVTIWEENMARVIQERNAVGFGGYGSYQREAEEKKADDLLLKIAQEKPQWAPDKAFEPEILSAQSKVASSQ